MKKSIKIISLILIFISIYILFNSFNMADSYAENIMKKVSHMDTSRFYLLRESRVNIYMIFSIKIFILGFIGLIKDFKLD